MTYKSDNKGPSIWDFLLIVILICIILVMERNGVAGQTPNQLHQSYDSWKSQQIDYSNY